MTLFTGWKLLLFPRVKMTPFNEWKWIPHPGQNDSIYRVKMNISPGSYWLFNGWKWLPPWSQIDSVNDPFIRKIGPSPQRKWRSNGTIWLNITVLGVIWHFLSDKQAPVLEFYLPFFMARTSLHGMSQKRNNENHRNGVNLILIKYCIKNNGMSELLFNYNTFQGGGVLP